ncbi:hypothetical protein NPJ27_001537 [Salmonella enterica]|nr:hypothetical protein [Salmonella enterica]
MKHRLRKRNQRWLSKKFRLAMLNDVPMDFFIRLPGLQAEIKNAKRLKRRGKLIPDWGNTIFSSGFASVPFVSPQGKIYHFLVVREKEELPENIQYKWQHSDCELRRDDHDNAGQ